MTTNAEGPASFQVRRLAFEYEERPGTFKERPVVIVLTTDNEALVLAVKITGHGPRPEYPGEVRLLDWRQEGLSKPSVARCSKVARVPIYLIASAPVLGSLSDRDADAVTAGLHEAGQA